mgnify:CR=1 FL=1
MDDSYMQGTSALCTVKRLCRGQVHERYKKEMLHSHRLLIKACCVHILNSSVRTDSSMRDLHLLAHEKDLAEPIFPV